MNTYWFTFIHFVFPCKLRREGSQNIDIFEELQLFRGLHIAPVGHASQPGAFSRHVAAAGTGTGTATLSHVLFVLIDI